MGIFRVTTSAAVIVVCTLITSSSRATIEYTATTSKSAVHPGEALYVNVTARNTDAVPATLNFGSSLQAQYIVDGANPYPDGGYLALTSAVIPPLSSYTWPLRYNWLNQPLALGPHNALGRVVTHGDSPNVAFDVVAPTLPIKSFALNFETLPDSSTQVTGVEEFWQYGVHFRSQTSRTTDRPGIYRAGSNGYLAINSTTYPPGFNIIADLDMNVYGATVDVSAATGVQITMIAKDAAGNVLDSVTSDPVPLYGQFVPVAIASSSVPIRSLEWWPSITNSALELDNLSLTVPEPATIVAAGLFAMTTLVSRRSRRAGCLG